MATLKNCVRCGKMFNSEGAEELCSDCVVEESKDLRKVTDFLRKNPMASVMTVHEKTGIPQQVIFRFVKSGSLKMRGPVERNEMPAVRQQHKKRYFMR